MRSVIASLLSSVAMLVLAGCSDLRSLPDPGTPGGAAVEAGAVSGGSLPGDSGTTPVATYSDAATTADAVDGCIDGAPCALPAMPCMTGLTVCRSAEAACVPSDKKKANGTACGTASVCLDGACVPCASGARCDVPGNSCRSGGVDCTAGKPQCIEIGDVPNGSPCGGATGNVCLNGSCQPCAAGKPCVPANACHGGTLECAGGVPKCIDTNQPTTPGTVCDVEKVCSATGQCVACVAGAPCDTSDPCKVGKTVCASGGPICMPSRNATNGTSCGNGKVCNDGNCVACTEGTACTPANKCHTGVLFCSSGIPECKDANHNAGNGSSCGTNMVCSNGECTACTANSSCTPDEPCKTGKTSCETGTSVCLPSGNVANGKSCGGSQVCLNGGCVACMPNAQRCSPAGDAVQSCRSDGSGYSDVTSCAAGCDTNSHTCRQCSGGTRECNGSCIDPSQPCGSSCPSGRLLCSGACVTGNCCDDAKCGECGVCSNHVCGKAANETPCGGGLVCRSGKCVPACTKTLCSGVCVDTSTDSNNCGRCGTTCTGGKFCKTGACFCPAGTEDVGGSCTSCGKDGQNCCAGDRCTDPNLACGLMTKLCTHCGSEGDICCDGTSGCDPGLECNFSSGPRFGPRCHQPSPPPDPMP
jgi:hypothetical protein